MDEDEEYELAPHKQLEKLKKEVERLRNNPLRHSGSSEDLLSAVDTLTKAIYELTDIFKTASEGIQAEPHHIHHNSKETHELAKRIDTISEENKKIASALVSLSEAVKSSQGQAPPPILPQAPKQGMDANAPPFLPPTPGSNMPPPGPLPPPVPGPITPAPPKMPSEAAKERSKFLDRFKR